MKSIRAEMAERIGLPNWANIVSCSSMSAATFRIVLLVAVLLTGLHLEEPAMANDVGGHGEVHLIAHDHTKSLEGAPGDADKDTDEICHHHCPVAPHIRVGKNDEGAIRWQEPHFVGPDAKLNSMPTAPPYKPPLS